MLPPARLLQQQGYRVAFACLESARQRVEAAQLPFISLGPAPPQEEVTLLLQQVMDPEGDPKVGSQAGVKHFVGGCWGVDTKLLNMLQRLIKHQCTCVGLLSHQQQKQAQQPVWCAAAGGHTRRLQQGVPVCIQHAYSI
jgi:UDP:flavonoid glycosyltransferase YjiC (YdhE family)